MLVVLAEVLRISVLTTVSEHWEGGMNGAILMPSYEVIRSTLANADCSRLLPSSSFQKAWTLTGTSGGNCT